MTLKQSPGCELCSVTGSLVEFQADHRIPVSLGGTGDPENRRKLCKACHKGESQELRIKGAAFRARVAEERETA